MSGEPPIVLASGSPARLRLLRSAGIEPEVQVSGVPEDDIDPGDPRTLVTTLARRKARAVAASRSRGLVLGCDSVLEVDGIGYGKPATPEVAVSRWHQLRGHHGILRTGHCLIDAATGADAEAVGSTTVRFGQPTDAQVAAYVATGEPLEVAGGFTLDGLGAVFIEGVDGDPSNVIGLSLVLLGRLLARLDSDITAHWPHPTTAAP